MFSVFLGLLLLLLSFGRQSAVVLIATQGAHKRCLQPDHWTAQWRFRKITRYMAFIFCLLMIVSEIKFSLFSRSASSSLTVPTIESGSIAADPGKSGR